MNKLDEKITKLNEGCGCSSFKSLKCVFMGATLGFTIAVGVPLFYDLTHNRNEVRTEQKVELNQGYNSKWKIPENNINKYDINTRNFYYPNSGYPTFQNPGYYLRR